LQAFQESRRELMAAIEGLTEAQMEERSIDRWSVKNHLAHIVQWDELRFLEINRISQGYQSLLRGMTDEQVEFFNTTSAGLRDSMSWAQLRWELETSRARVIDAIRNITPDGLDESRYGEAGLSGGARHEQEHAETIRRWRASRGL
jgi:uncharacterized damage-inducible protein DinB